MAFVYAFVSRLLDATLPYLHIPLLLGLFAGVTALLSGNLTAGFRTRIGAAYLALTVYLMAGLPFSIWRGGSIGVFKDWIRAMLIWAFIVSLVTSYRQCRMLLNTIVLAAVTAAALGLWQGTASSEGRLVMTQGRFGNPNDLALVLLIGIPLLWRLYSEGGSPGLIRKLVALAAGSVTLMAFFKSGSRGGLYAFVFGLLLVLFRLSITNKIRLALVSVLLFAVTFAVLPGYLRQRYFTLSSGQEDAQSMLTFNVTGAAAASTENREALLWASLATTLRYPIFGVGLGNFAVYQFDLRKGTGLKADWLGTHNTYTQLSSEAGVPALAIFISILVLSWRSLTRVIRASGNDPRPLARNIHYTAHAMQVCLGAFCFFLIFNHAAYDILPHMMTAATLVLVATSEKELQSLAPLPAGRAGLRPPIPAFLPGSLPERRLNVPTHN